MDLWKKKKTCDRSSVFLVVKISILYLCRNDRTVKIGHGGKAQQRYLLGRHSSCIEADICNYSGTQTVEQNPNTEWVEHHKHFIPVCYSLRSKCMFLYFDKFKEDACFTVPVFLIHQFLGNTEKITLIFHFDSELWDGRRWLIGYMVTWIKNWSEITHWPTTELSKYNDLDVNCKVASNVVTVQNRTWKKQTFSL